MQGDIQESLKFLKKWSANGPWVLTSIQTDKKGISTATFNPSKEAELKTWLNDYIGKRNIYFHVNNVNRDLSSKALKEDIKSAGWLHVDVDPKKGEDLEQERENIISLFTDKLPKGISKPTVIVFSGGGYQAFWKLDEPFMIDGDIKKAEEFELYNKRLEQIFGGDHCHNVDRIMRLPGTVNIPDAKKKKAGRVEEVARCLEFNDEKHSLDKFKKAQNVQVDGNGIADQKSISEDELDIPGNLERILDLSELDVYDVPERIKVIIAQGTHPDRPKSGDNSRSAWLFDCVCGLLRCGVPDGVVYSIITDSGWGIADSVRENKNPDKYARRQISNAKQYSEDPNLQMMNQRHAIIGNIGGKCRVIEEVEDEILKRSRLTLSSFEDIRNRYSHLKAKVGVDKENKDVFMPLGKYWLLHPKRRQFDYMRFMPQGDRKGVYNLWRGFSVEPKPGNCSLYLSHLEENVCGGDKKHFEYLIKWMARAVQNPASPGEVAVVMRGGKGVGKSIVCKIFGRLFGRHFLHVANPSHLVGNFNAHLRDVICLFADEAFFAGDKRHESVLKMLVTEDSIPIEQKGVDVETYPNYVHLMMAANDPHVIRASGDERRYYVLEVLENKKQNKEYFGNMMKQMENDGYEALLFHLQNIDLTDFQVRDVPQTDALQEQKLLSMNIEEEWWYRKLQNGRLLDTDGKWNQEIQCDSMTNDFTNYAEKWKVNRRGNETHLGRFLARVCSHSTKQQKRVSVEEYDRNTQRTKINKKRVYFYNFGPLLRCRDEWERLHGKTHWDKPIDEDDDDEQFSQEVF